VRAMLSNVSSTLTVREIAQRLKVDPDKVRRWIHSGTLKALNVAGNAFGRPRYRISIADLLAFEERRRVQPQIKVGRRQRRPRSTDEIIEFF
jgi:excisionase family DNA binding protein